MKNKKWKRKAKRLKCKVDVWCEYEFCKLSNSTSLAACCMGILTLEFHFKQNK